MIRTILVSVAALALGACGGGGGSGDGGGVAANNQPVANAGPAQEVVTGALVTLNGSASSDPDGDTLTYQWTLTSRPQGSTATLSNVTSVAPTFRADVEGGYVARLVVNDGIINSAPATVMLTAVRPPLAGLTWVESSWDQANWQ